MMGKKKLSEIESEVRGRFRPIRPASLRRRRLARIELSRPWSHCALLWNAKSRKTGNRRRFNDELLSVGDRHGNLQSWAVFEGGVFRPLDKVTLPENTQYEFEPRPVATDEAGDDMDEIYEVLSRRYNSGHTDTAERHNEHQP